MSDLRETISAYYTERLDGGGCCGDGCGCSPAEPASSLDVPSFGCGDPTAFAGLRAGEHVLDLGSGAGLDAFRAAEAVGPEGRVTGVDMTPAMLARAREGARELGLRHVEFREGHIEALPVEDASVDAVLSNCVINLSPDKRRVFHEAYRVLRAGGRLAVQDVLRHGTRLAAPTAEGWCACVDGAEPAEEYAAYLQDAGFVEIDVEGPPEGLAPGETYSASIRATKPRVRAARPHDHQAIATLLREAGLPLEGLRDTDLFVLEAGDQMVGVAGLESHPPYALLRSLAVAPGARGQGYARALLGVLRHEVQQRGIRGAYALTTTIPGLLRRWGLVPIERSDLPSELEASAELNGACPGSAAAFVMPLE